MLRSSGWLAILAVLLGVVPSLAAERNDAHGDPLPQGAVARLGTLRFRHGNTITSVVLSADGKVLATGDHDDVVRLWDPVEGKLLRTLTTRPPWTGETMSWFSDLAMTADGSTIASCGQERILRVWETATGKELWQLKGNGVSRISFSADGKLLAATLNSGGFGYWRVQTGEQVHEFKEVKGPLYGLAIAPDGKTLATASGDRTARVWDAATGKELYQFTGFPSAGATAVTYSPDGKLLAVAGQGQPAPVVRLFDLASGKELKSFEPDLSGVIRVAFTPDGKELLVAGIETSLRFFDVESGKLSRQIDVPSGRVWAAALSGDGKTVAVGGAHRDVLLWDAKTGKELHRPAAHDGAVDHLAFLADGRTLVTGGRDGTVRRWDLTKYAERDRFAVKGTVFGLVSEGAEAVSGDRQGLVHVYDPATGKELRSHKEYDGWLETGTVSGNGKVLATYHHPGARLVLTNLENGVKLSECEGRAPGGRATALTADGSVLVTHESDNTLRIWDASKGRERRRVQDSVPQGLHLALSHDGRWLSGGGDDGSARLYEVLTGSKFRQLNGHNGAITSQAFSSDGLTLAVGDRGGVHLWDLRTGRERGVFKGHAGDVVGLAFSPDGKLLASGGVDTTVLLWDLASVPPAPAPAALTPRDVDNLWDDLGSAGVAAGPLAVLALGGSPKLAVPFLTARLQPAASVDPKRVEQWVVDLDSDKPETTRSAMTELGKQGPVVEVPLRNALARASDPDTKLRIHVLLSRLATALETPELRQAIRGVHVLETAATPEAKVHLEKLAGGAPEGEVTREARAALSRLARRAGEK